MAYMNQEMKAKIAPVVKKICQEFGVKGTLSVRNHTALVLTLKSGKIDFIANSNRVCSNDLYQMRNGFRPNTSGNCDVNPYWYSSHYDGAALEFLTKIVAAMNDGNWDMSDAQTDYFNVGWYISINIGRWNSPYVVEA